MGGGNTLGQVSNRVLLLLLMGSRMCIRMPVLMRVC